MIDLVARGPPRILKIFAKDFFHPSVFREAMTSMKRTSYKSICDSFIFNFPPIFSLGQTSQHNSCYFAYD